MKQLHANILTAIVTAVLVLIATRFVGGGLDTVEAGMDAATIAQIETVLDEKMVTTINGETKTYGEALSLISTEQAVMKNQLDTATRALEALTD